MGGCINNETVADGKSCEQNDPCNTDVTTGSTGNVISGEMKEHISLYSTSGTGLTTDFALYYNSHDAYHGALGQSWGHSYEIVLKERTDSSVLLRSGTGHYYTYTPSGTGYTNQPGDYSALSKASDGTFVLTKQNGTVYTFGANSRIASIADRNNNHIDFTYNGDDLVAITETSGRTTSLAYDGNGKLVSVTDPAGHVYGFTVVEMLQSVALPGGNGWHFAYTGNAFMTDKTDPNGNLTTYVYDNDYHLIGSVDPQGRERVLSYPEVGDATGTTIFTEKDGSNWLYTYNSETGALLEKTDPAGNATSYTYDAQRNLTSKTGPGIGTTSYNYDGSGNLTSTTDAEGKTTTYTYNAFGQVLTITEDDGSETIYSYDEHGNLTKAKTPAGTSIYSYDATGRLEQITAPGDLTMVFSYDAQGNLKTVTGPDGKVTTFTYDAAGNRLSATDADGHITRYEYDANGQVNKVIDAYGKITGYRYDAAGNRNEVIDANGHSTRYEYNAQGQVVLMIDALGSQTSFEYSGNAGCSTCSGGVDQLTALTDAKGQTTHFGYNALGQLVKEVDPLGRETLYHYNVAGRVDQKTDANGNVITYHYDAAGRLTSKAYPDGTTASFSYDTRGRLEKAANQYISYDLTYDAADRLASVSDNRGYTLAYSYDAAGQRSSLTGPADIHVGYAYDDAGRLEQIASSAGTFRFGYDTLGRRNKLSFPNGVETDYVYDDLGRLTQLATRNGSVLITQNIYTQDNVGNRLSNQDLRTTQSYNYDAIYRLTEAVSASPGFSAENNKGQKGKGVSTAVQNQREFYQYDPVGNRLNSSAHVTYTYNEGNQLLSAGDIRYTYDHNGNRTQRITPQGITSYTWNAENQLVAVKLPDGSRVDFAYDPFGRRIEKSVTDSDGGKTTRFVYDGEDILFETDASGEIANRYIHGPGIDEPLALVTRKETTYYHADGLGSIVAMTDDQARNVQQYEYDSFGNQHDMKNRIKQPYGYTGREHDRETALRYYRARYYDGEVGMFISEDPIGIVGGINQYIYANNNSINFSDPSGLLTCTYDISSHTLTCTNNSGSSFATSNAKSGQGQCQDNIECVDQENEGPIPPGSYSISPPGYSSNHPSWLYLDPDPNNEMYSRSEFFIHGWGVSEGCVTIHYNSHRDMVEEWATQDNGGTLNVIP